MPPGIEAPELDSEAAELGTEAPNPGDWEKVLKSLFEAAKDSFSDRFVGKAFDPSAFVTNFGKAIGEQQFEDLISELEEKNPRMAQAMSSMLTVYRGYQLATVAAKAAEAYEEFQEAGGTYALAVLLLAL